MSFIRVFTWTQPRSVVSLIDEINNINSRISLLSNNTIPWEITLSIKDSKQATSKYLQKLDLSKDLEDKRTYFLRFHDINIICCRKVKSGHLLLNHLESESNISVEMNVVTKTTVKAHGNRYIIDNFVISVGVIETSPSKCVIEVVRHDIDENELSVIEEIARSLVMDLISNSSKIDVNEMEAFNSQKSSNLKTKSEFIDSNWVRERATQWIQAISVT